MRCKKKSGEKIVFNYPDDEIEKLKIWKHISDILQYVVSKLNDEILKIACSDSQFESKISEVKKMFMEGGDEMHVLFEYVLRYREHYVDVRLSAFSMICESAKTTEVVNEKTFKLIMEMLGDNVSLREWSNLIRELISLSIQVAKVVEPVVSNASPEGHLPMDPDSDSILKLQATIRRSIGKRFQTAVIESEACVPEFDQVVLDKVKSHAVSAQILLLCCWRTHKEVSLLFGEISDRIPVSNDDNIESGILYVAQVHALNILRALFRDSCLSDFLIPFVSEALMISITGFKSHYWIVRNSSHLLFSALMTRIFGVSGPQDEIGKKNRLTSRTFFSYYKEMYAFLYDELKQCTEIMNQNRERENTCYTTRVAFLEIILLSLSINSKLDELALKLWQILFNLIIDDEPEIKQLAAEFISSIEIFHPDLERKILPAVPSFALEYMIKIFVSEDICPLSRRIAVLLNWMLSCRIQAVDCITDEQPFDRGELNVYVEDLFLTSLTYDILSWYLKSLNREDISSLRVCNWKDISNPQETTFTFDEIVTTCLDELKQFFECLLSREGILPLIDTNFDLQILQISQRLYVISCFAQYVSLSVNYQALELLEDLKIIKFRTFFFCELLSMTHLSLISSVPSRT
ncbi:Thyroid adenoma-associated protein like protein [Argiope bruennichi]|uniref:Thyroid adenoma-associated protein like protein n=1 Tax=Argiope bruennichi TaxID=94029 RepID=A0A8T0FZN3_ARGBR|nr:Thyroid adenoma-associated protein like protein [Argiope bruennichi]